MTDLSNLVDPQGLHAAQPRPEQPKPGVPYVHVGHHASVLRSVRDPACVLGLWQRELAASIVDPLESLSFSHLPAFESVGNAQSVRVQAHVAIQHAGLAGTAVGRWLESDIAGLSCRYAAVTGMRALHVRLAAVDGDACRYFHVDRLSFRLLCTYRGGGTQWVAPGTQVEGGSAPDLTASLEAAPDKINAMPTGAVAILRGVEPRTGQHGLLHRSPPARDLQQGRLVLTISAGGNFA